MRTSLIKAIAITLVLTLGAFQGSAIQAKKKKRLPRYKYRQTRLADGLIYRRILDRRGPNRIKVLEIDPAANLTVDVALAQNKLPGRSPTSDMAANRNAVAAVNGTFGLPWGRPMGLFVEDANVKATPLIWGRAFSMAFDESRAFVGHPVLGMKLTRLSTGGVIGIQRWNEGEPGRSEVAGYTMAGGIYEKPPRDACSARLFPTGGFRWTSSGGVERNLLVDRVRCVWPRMNRDDGIVVSARRGSTRADAIAGLIEGETVSLSWSLEWPFVLDSISGNPTLLENGRMTAYRCSSPFCGRNPRTGVGVTADNRILLVTVDGRQRKYSVGMSLVEFAEVFRKLGAEWALNLDGGGSTTMVVRDRVVNRPSSGYERAVSSAIVVLRGPDPDEPKPSAPQPEPAPSPSPSVTIPPVLDPDDVLPIGEIQYARAPQRSLSMIFDPGSTGGLLDAIMRGDVIGGPSRLPYRFERLVRIFRGRL